MGGTSTQQQQSQSTSQPWAPAQPALQGILGQLQPLIDNSGLSPTSSGAIDTLEKTAQQGNPYSGAIGGVTTNLLNGGGATNQNGNLQGGLDAYRTQTNPLASNTDYNPYNTPGFSDAINTIIGDTTNSVNGQFAAAGRDLSGMNTQTLGRGIMQGVAPTIAAQYNQNVQNQQGAAQNLYNAQNATSGAITGNNQTGLGNQQAGAALAPTALAAQNYAPTQMLNLEQLRQSIPAQNLGLLAQIGVPIAGLGGQTSGTSSGSSTMSGAQQFAALGQGAAGFGKLLFG